jgi:hypothetical protein
VVAFIIGTSVNHGARHAPYHVGATEADCSTDSTHRDTLSEKTRVTGEKIDRTHAFSTTSLYASDYPFYSGP